MFQRLAIRATALFWMLAPRLALAADPQPPERTMEVDAPFGIDTLLSNMAQRSWMGGYAVCAAIFVAGAFIFIGGSMNEQWKGQGKGMMIGAVVGAIIIAGAQAIMNTVLSFVFPS